VGHHPSSGVYYLRTIVASRCKSSASAFIVQLEQAHMSGYLPSGSPAFSHALLISSISFFVSLIFIASTFSSSAQSHSVPGISITSSHCAINQSQRHLVLRNTFLFRYCLDLLNNTSQTLGEILLNTAGSNFLRLSLKYFLDVTTPPSPGPSGLYAITATPSSLQVLSRSICGSSMSSEKGEYSTCTAEIG
jgi:hypothetical protein